MKTFSNIFRYEFMSKTPLLFRANLSNWRAISGHWFVCSSCFSAFFSSSSFRFLSSSPPKMSEDLLDDDDSLKKPMDLLSCPICNNKFSMDPKEVRVVRGDEPDVNEEVGLFRS